MAAPTCPACGSHAFDDYPPARELRNDPKQELIAVLLPRWRCVRCGCLLHFADPEAPDAPNAPR